METPTPTTRPVIHITKEAYYRIMHMIWECDTEVNGLARITRKGRHITIDDVAVLKQYASGGYVEHDTDALLDFYLEKGDDAPNWLVQWHSHVNMGVFWSGQDEEAVAAIGDTAEWAISIVFNKRQDYKCRIDMFRPVPFKNIDCQLTVLEDVPDFKAWAAEMREAFVRPASEAPRVERRKKGDAEQKDETPVANPLLTPGQMWFKRQEGEGTPLTEAEEQELAAYLMLDAKAYEEYIGKASNSEKRAVYNDMLMERESALDAAYADWKEENSEFEPSFQYIPKDTKREQLAIAMGFGHLPDETGKVMGDFSDEDIDELYERFSFNGSLGSPLPIIIGEQKAIPLPAPIDSIEHMWKEVCSSFGLSKAQLRKNGMGDAEVKYIYQTEIAPTNEPKVALSKSKRKRITKLLKKKT